MIQHILVLCIGNICRSPMAQGLLQQALPGKQVSSAGIGAKIGHPADPFAQQLMQEQGINIAAHRAQNISARLVNEAQLILVMDQEQKQHVERSYVAAKGKVFLLCDASKTDIPDPYQKNIDSFRKAYALIAEGVNDWVSRLVKIA